MAETKAMQKVKRPNVGDVVEMHVGACIVNRVLESGTRLLVTDAKGRQWDTSRSTVGWWTVIA